MTLVAEFKPFWDTAGEGAGGAAPAPAPAPESAPAPAPAPEPLAAPWTSEGVWTLGEGETAAPWYSLIPEDSVRAHVEAKQYKNPAELAMANYSLTRLQRGDPKVVGVPEPDAPPEVLNEFYSKIGRPETPEGYEFNFGEGTQVSDDLVGFARTAFHEAGLTPQQAQVVAEKWNAFAAEQNAAGQTDVAAQNEAEIQALTERWGADLDKNRAAGQRAVQALGLSNEMIERIEQSIGSAPVVELLAMIGRKSDESGFKSGSAQGGPADPRTMTTQQAVSRINQLQGDKAFMERYMDAKHPQHADAVREMEQLFART